MKRNMVNIDETIKKAAKEAIKEFDKEKREEKRKKVFHNTRLLLKHYNDLVSHVSNAIDDVNKLEQDLESIGELDRDELYILSIKKSKSKTLIMIAHIDMAMEILKKKQYKLCSAEKYKALELFYLDEKTYEEVGEILSCSPITARRWINEMVNELSIHLFGLDGLKLDMVN
ncbi:helix-turn-helix domain-containing protein [Clostridium sp.]|uniref:helix-turn-helix domain-containing protein n=1 Tax=Clostridium sp. TaxID=1506 RepID=UPI0035A0F860